MTEHPRGDDKGWADSPVFRRRFVIGLAAISAIVAILGFIPAFQKDHPHFAIEGLFIFFAVYGFAAFMFIVLAGQHLRKLVARDERYYDDRE